MSLSATESGCVRAQRTPILLSDYRLSYFPARNFEILSFMLYAWDTISGGTCPIAEMMLLK